jgi:epoxyqueuosine reductase
MDEVDAGCPAGLHENTRMNAVDRSNLVRTLCRDAGFDRCGCAHAGPVDRAAFYRSWLLAGHAGKMDYLHRHAAERVDASVLLPGAQSVVVCALNYHQPEPASVVQASDGPSGRVAMYAWGGDYHKIIKGKLFAVIDALRERIDEPFEAKVCVDTAPLLEREYAARAGVGWIGKNTLVMHESLGSYFFLGAIVTTLELATDAPALDHCGSCTRCLEACPTHAFPAPYQMNASRCISYLTIELRDESIPVEFHESIGDWVFGCDVCQQVCPHNRRAPVTREPKLAIRIAGTRMNLGQMIGWTDEQYGAVLQGSAMKRAKPAMLRRNARVVIGNKSETDSR